jgi:cation diffusion facilitator family transporter
VATSVAAFIAIWVSSRPADEGHPYGHSKAEYFSTVIEGVLILVAALAILREAWHGIQNPQPLDAPLLGLAINGVATAVNCAWGLLLIRRGKASRSPALAADGRHLMTDVYTSGGVLVGVGLVMVTGWMVLDSLIAGGPSRDRGQQGRGRGGERAADAPRGPPDLHRFHAQRAA